jgi:hypothetical protein
VIGNTLCHHHHHQISANVKKSKNPGYPLSGKSFGELENLCPKALLSTVFGHLMNILTFQTEQIDFEPI